MKTYKLFLFATAILLSSAGFAQSGVTGALTWSISGNTLTISGEGDMPDYRGGTPAAPWYDYRISITTVVIENGVTGIGNDAFWENRNITTVSIPESVTKIGVDAFQMCERLGSIVIPESVTSIGDLAFNGCINLKSVTVPGSVKSIGNRAFDYCTGLTSAVISEGVTTMGNQVFSMCSNLTSVTLPGSITSIEDRTFSNCSNLASITIPEKVKVIGRYAFRNCSSLASIAFPASVTTIRDFAFSGCTGLAAITVPGTVITLGAMSFGNCTGLTSVSISDGVRIIHNSAFAGCNNLASISIPASVTHLGEINVINDCPKLKKVKVGWLTPLAVAYTAGADYSDCILEVPAGTADLYRAANFWKDFIIVEESTSALTSVSATQAKIYFNNANELAVEQAQGSDLTVFNTMGGMIYAQTNLSEKEIINASRWANGIYIVCVGNEKIKLIKPKR
ncbi:MAG: leucine-rich repeat protein [Prevotellaceae bacterium]|jgi:hypothetical protein|nr:leucine-rich repeat protein [Prevotellaceae bacterium]